jgi:endonuclease-8
MRRSAGVPQDVSMPEGHTLFALARDLDAAFAGSSPQVSSPQGRFTAGAGLLDGREMLHATSWGKHLFAEFAGDAWLHVHPWPHRHLHHRRAPVCR